MVLSQAFLKLKVRYSMFNIKPKCFKQLLDCTDLVKYCRFLSLRLDVSIFELLCNFMYDCILLCVYVFNYMGKCERSSDPSCPVVVMKCYVCIIHFIFSLLY